jgi:uncharacterized protein with HEPN domain
VRVRLIEIGEAVNDMSSGLVASEPRIPWEQVAGMRDNLVHRYFDTVRSMVEATVTEDLTELEEAVHRMLGRVAEPDDIE